MSYNRYGQRDKAGWVAALFVVFLTGVPFGIWALTAIRNNIVFSNGCGGHLKRAADANTVAIAQEELNTALEYMEQNNLTSGTTYILIPHPSKDVGFWYKNVKACRDDLSSLPPSDLGRTEVVNTSLLKLRQSLLDENGTVTLPPGIQNFPNNTGRAVWGWLSCLFWAAVGGYYFFTNVDIE